MLVLFEHYSAYAIITGNIIFYYRPHTFYVAMPLIIRPLHFVSNNPRAFTPYFFLSKTLMNEKICTTVTTYVYAFFV